MQGTIMSMIGGILIGIWVMTLCGGIKTYLSVMEMPINSRLVKSDKSGQWKIPSREETMRNNVPLSEKD